jgi:hypothetical protein
VFDDWIRITADNQYVWSGPYNNWTGPKIPGACELSTSWNQRPNVDFTDKIQKEGVVEFKVQVNVSGNGEGYAFAKIKADIMCQDRNNDVISNTCTVYQADPDCTLIEENVDGVVTYNSGAITGLTPLTQFKTISEEACQITIERPWFKKMRKYRCDVKTNTDLTKMIARSEEIKTTTTPTDYQDVQYTKSGVISDSGTLNFGNVPTVAPCTQVCKVRKPVYPDVALDGVDRGVVEPSHYDVSYKECSADNICPSSNGESVIQQCQCANDFGEATAIMQVMRNAGRDMICSTGIEQSL